MAGEPAEIEIVRLGAQGDGIAETTEGGPRFVPFALPGERVRVVGDEMAEIVARRQPRAARADLPPFRHVRRLRRPAHERGSLCRVEARHRRRGVPPARPGARDCAPAAGAAGLAPARRADSQARRREHHARLSRPPQPCAVRSRGVSGAGCPRSSPRCRPCAPWPACWPAERDALHGAGDARPAWT